MAGEAVDAEMGPEQISAVEPDDDAAEDDLDEGVLSVLEVEASIGVGFGGHRRRWRV